MGSTDAADTAGTTEPLPQDVLDRVHDAMAVHVAAGTVPGLVTLVARGDHVHVDAIGTPAFDDPAPLARDAIFRIASLTKPIVAAAAMSLVEEGVLQLDAPIDDLVPEVAVAGRRVLRSLGAELDDTVPARRPITVDDLLTSRMGFGALMDPPGTHPIQRAEAEAQLQSIGGPPWPPGPHDLDSWIAALGELPLMYQPGERWLYGTSSSVLGIVLARATGTTLDVVLRERILGPLGMDDTGFWVPPDRIDRLTTLYMRDATSGELSVLDAPPNSWWDAPAKRPDAAGWLVSTVDDLFAFVAMLLAGGAAADGTPVLSPAGVELMTTDRLTADQRDEVFGGIGSWGFGMLVPAAGADPAALPRGFGWQGGTGVTWQTNPWSGATGILFTQRHASSPEPNAITEDFWAALAPLGPG